LRCTAPASTVPLSSGDLLGVGRSTVTEPITDRLTELKPLVDEYARLQAAAAALDVPAPAAHPRSARAAARPSAGRRVATHGRRGRPKGSGARGVEALELVKANPGITVSEIAEKMGIKQNYLYRVLPGLADDGLVVKDGRGWKPKDVA
jgi:hypothetical protein